MSSTPTPRKRGRPPSIDSAAAMQAIVELFRDKGYAAVSLDDLSDATGLSRPSLYRSFGDKLSMYVSAIEAFGSQVQEQAVPALLAGGDLERSLSGFFDKMLEIYYRDESVAAGCLVYGTAPGSADLPAVKKTLFASIEQLDSAMMARIAKAHPNAPQTKVEWAAEMASNTLIAFSARAKSGAKIGELSKMGARSAQAICALLERD